MREEWKMEKWLKIPNPNKKPKRKLLFELRLFYNSPPPPLFSREGRMFMQVS
jgi:hypothetical protein